MYCAYDKCTIPVALGSYYCGAHQIQYAERQQVEAMHRQFYDQEETDVPPSTRNWQTHTPPPKTAPVVAPFPKRLVDLDRVKSVLSAVYGEDTHKLQMTFGEGMNNLIVTLDATVLEDLVEYYEGLLEDLRQTIDGLR